MDDHLIARRAVRAAATARRLWPSARSGGQSVLADQLITALEDRTMSVQELAETLAVERTVVTKMTQRLVKEGLVEVVEPKARRAVWRVTESGADRQRDVRAQLVHRHASER